MAQEGQEKISLIAAIGTNRALGKNNGLLWELPEDLRRFKTLTSGHPVIMGRKTWESIPEKSRPLPGRTNIVITQSEMYSAPGATCVRSFERALEVAQQAEGAEEIFVIGGAQVYTFALPYADRLYLTLVADAPDADVFFPEYETIFTREVCREEKEGNGLWYAWVTLERT